jgi:probable F420-dependent oxidoreductase
MNRLGITIPGPGPLRDQIGVYHELEDLGFTDFWTPEVDGADGFTPLALAAAVTTSVRLGIAIAPAYTRGPAILAQTAAALADAAPGRFVLGVGTSSKVIVESWNAVAFDQPYRKVRDVVSFLRAALSGEKVTMGLDTFSVSSFRLSRVPEMPPPIFVAGLREQMLRLAGRVGDGVIINWLSATDVGRVVAEATKERGDPLDVVCRIPVCMNPDPAAARTIGRFAVNAQLNVPVYASFQEWLGRRAQLEAMWGRWAAGDRKGALEVIPDEVVDDLVVHGSPEECVEHLRRFVDAGVTCPAVALMPVPGMEWTELARALAGAWAAAT